MRKNCPDREDIFMLAKGMTSEREALAHITNCAGCRKIFESYRRLDDVLEQWNPDAQASPWFDARVRAAASQPQARGMRGFFGLELNRWLAAPVLAALLVMVGVIAFRHSPPPVPVKPVTQVAAVHPAVAPAQAAKPAPAAPQSGAQEVSMYQNLSVLEDYDMLAGFDVISELPKGSSKVAD